MLAFLTSSIAFSQDTTTRKQDTGRSAFDTTQRMIPVDSIPKLATPISSTRRTDSIMKHHLPRTAAIRSAILPGLGQIYNRKYWKLPIVYGALGIAGAVFAYNLTNYKDLRFAYKAKYQAQPRLDPATGTTLPGDSTNYHKIRPDLAGIDMNALRSYRDEFRRNIDYSALAIILVWGLNVVDATVDAHLKAFDVSPELSLKVKFGASELAGTNGVSLILAFK